MDIWKTFVAFGIVMTDFRTRIVKTYNVVMILPTYCVWHNEHVMK